MGSPFQVSGGTTDDRLNDVSGSLIVYTALDATGLGMIRLYDISNGSTSDLMPVPDSVKEARIHGARVAWVQGAPGATRIEVLRPAARSGRIRDGARIGLKKAACSMEATAPTSTFASNPHNVHR